MQTDPATDLETLARPPLSDKAPTMGNIAKVNYSHLDMIDYIIAHPGCGLKELAARYGYSIGWISNVMASDAWESAMAARRAELVDPVMHATLEERFRGVAILSLERLKEKLEAPMVSDNVVLKAVELGAKGLGAGGYAPPQAPAQDHLANLANRLIALQSNVQKGVVYEGQAITVESTDAADSPDAGESDPAALPASGR